MSITLYACGPARSARCHWTLLETGLDFELVDACSMIGGDELRALHPMAKVPEMGTLNAVPSLAAG